MPMTSGGHPKAANTILRGRSPRAKIPGEINGFCLVCLRRHCQEDSRFTTSDEWVGCSEVADVALTSRFGGIHLSLPFSTIYSDRQEF